MLLTISSSGFIAIGVHNDTSCVGTHAATLMCFLFLRRQGEREPWKGSPVVSAWVS